MGRGGLTTKPINVAVIREWITEPGILALIEHGHTVRSPERFSFEEIDLIIAPAAGWTKALLAGETRKSGETYYPYIDAGVAHARRRDAK